MNNKNIFNLLKQINLYRIIIGMAIFLLLTGETVALSNSGGGNWQYSKDLTINNPGDALVYYQVFVNLTGDNFPIDVHTNGNDIRFTNMDNAEFAYWIEEWDYTNSNMKVWVNVTTVPTGTSTIRMYYGNPSAASSSNGDTTFQLFDDFLGASLDTVKWNYGGTPTISDNILVLDGVYENIASKILFNQNVALRTKANFKLADASDWIGFIQERFQPNAVFELQSTRNPSACGGANTFNARNCVNSGCIPLDICTVISGATDAFNIFDLTWLPSGNKYFVNGIMEADHTTEIPSINLPLTAHIEFDINTIQIDWILIRKYASPEPSVGVIEENSNSVHNINKGTDYTTIQAAINDANSGDEIYVDSGTYHENVDINKRLILKGIDTGIGKPIIDGNEDVVRIAFDETSFEGFNITKSVINCQPRAYVGIFIYSNKNIIRNNDISKQCYGITISGNTWRNGLPPDGPLTYNIIENNHIYNNYFSGIYTVDSDYNNITMNNITDETYNYYGVGMQLTSSNYSNIDNNNGNTRILIAFSNHNNLTDNNIISSTNAVELQGSHYNTLTNNNLNDNNDASIYLHNSNDNTIDSNDISNSSNGINLYNSNNNSMNGNTISNNSGASIYLHESNDNTININDISNSGCGICMRYSNKNILTDNNVNFINGPFGIQLYDNSNDNILSGNNVSNNRYGIHLYSSNNTLRGNNFSYNYYGIYIQSSNGNNLSTNNILKNDYGIYIDSSYSGSQNTKIIGNNLIENGIQAIEKNMPEVVWNSNYPIGGNYWSDYNRSDVLNGPNQDQPGSDGIGDTPYPIPEGSSVDRYPLMSPYSDTPKTTNILALDTSDFDTQILTALSGVTFTEVLPTDFETIDLSTFDVLYVGSAFQDYGMTIPAQDALDALNIRKNDIANFVSSGKGLVALSEPVGTGRYAWIPVNVIGSERTDKDSVHISDPGHEVMKNLNDNGLSGWGDSYHNIFTDVDSLSVLATGADQDNLPVTIAGNFGNGRIVLTGQDPDFHYVNGVQKQQVELLNNVIKWIHTGSAIPAPTITVTSPNGGENWQAGTTQSINWSYTGNPGDNIKIELLKGGVLNQTINSSTPISTGSYDWIVPAIDGSDYQVKITSTTNSAYNDVSDGYFTIFSEPEPPISSSITLTSPNGGESWQVGITHPIQWTYTGDPGSNIKIEIIKDGVVDQTITSSTQINSGYYDWTVSLISEGSYQIKITSTTNNAISDISEHFFIARIDNMLPTINSENVTFDGKIVAEENNYIQFSSDFYPDPIHNIYIWDFGDETTPVIGRMIGKAYSKMGEYDVKLTIKNDAGGSSKTNTVKIYVVKQIVEGLVLYTNFSDKRYPNSLDTILETERQIEKYFYKESYNSVFTNFTTNPNTIYLDNEDIYVIDGNKNNMNVTAMLDRAKDISDIHEIRQDFVVLLSPNIGDVAAFNLEPANPVKIFIRSDRQGIPNTWDHEIGHALGFILKNSSRKSENLLWDLYSGGTIKRQDGIRIVNGGRVDKNYELMSSGYLSNLSSMSRVLLGWMTIREVDFGDTIDAKAIEQGNYRDTAFIFKSISYNNRQYVIEAREFPKKDVAIYKLVDYSLIQDVASPRPGNMFAGSPAVYINKIGLLDIGFDFVQFKISKISDNPYSARVEIAEPFISEVGGWILQSTKSIGKIAEWRITNEGTMADIDLHAISPDGKHIGMNYETGVYESEIPGALYSGDLTNGEEWIFVPSNIEVKYYIDSHDFQKFIDENPDFDPNIKYEYSTTFIKYGMNPKLEQLPDGDWKVQDKTFFEPQISTIGPGETKMVILNYNITFLPPITTMEQFNLTNGSTLPIKFAARNSSTNEFIYDDTVNLTVTDSTGSLVTYFTNGTGTNNVRINSAEEQYIVNLHTKDYGLKVGETYAITVTFGESNSLKGYAVTYFTLIEGGKAKGK